MADVRVPLVETVTPTNADTVTGVQGGAVKRFGASPTFGQLAASGGAALIGHDAGTVAAALRAQYPFRQGSTAVSATLAGAIKDVYVEAADKTMRLAFYTIERNNASDGWYIRLGAFTTPGDVLDTSVGNNGIVAAYVTAVDPEVALTNGKRLQTLTLTPSGAVPAVTACKVTIDWEAIGVTTNICVGIQNYAKAGLSERVFDSAAREASFLTATNLLESAPRNMPIWASSNTFAAGGFDQFVLAATISGADPTKRYGLHAVRLDVADPGRRFIGLNEYAVDGTPGARVALFDTTGTKPTATPEGMTETVYLGEQNASGVTATMTVNWSALTGPGPNGTGAYFYYSPAAIADGELSVSATDGDTLVTGYNVINFTVDGVNARLTTSDDYGNGEPDTLLLLMHGNGGDYTYSPSATFKTWARANKVSFACITGQDYTTSPYGSAASGWGGDIHRNRTVKLYQYLLKHYDLHPSVVLAGASMGGLVMGQLAYYKPFPIRCCIGIGPVPNLSYIFANGGETRKSPIRNAYGMASGGGDDAALETFIQGCDWYDLGMSADASPRKYGFPRMHLYAGDGDTTYSVDFGGATHYTTIKDSIQRAGGFCTFTVVAAVTHAADALWDQVVTDGVMTKELG
jgi:pimeloyl-ACP methyl ester carboxylesterase